MVSYLTGAVDKVPEYDKRSRSHYWIAAVAFHVPNPQAYADGETLHMDNENLVLVGPVGCYFCEEPWSKYLHHRACPGDPKE